MNLKRMIGIIVSICGIATIFVSIYIKNQVATGKEIASKAQSQVDVGTSLFSLTPVTKEIGKGISGQAQSKIDEGQRQISYYEGLANGLLIGGIGLIILGGAVVLLGRKKL